LQLLLPHNLETVDLSLFKLDLPPLDRLAKCRFPLEVRQMEMLAASLCLLVSQHKALVVLFASALVQAAIQLVAACPCKVVEVPPGPVDLYQLEVLLPERVALVVL
jgi:hypothetical protein